MKDTRVISLHIDRRYAIVNEIFFLNCTDMCDSVFLSFFLDFQSFLSFTWAEVILFGEDEGPCSRNHK